MDLYWVVPQKFSVTLKMLRALYISVYRATAVTRNPHSWFDVPVLFISYKYLLNGYDTVNRVQSQQHLY